MKNWKRVGKNFKIEKMFARGTRNHKEQVLGGIVNHRVKNVEP